MLLSLLVNQRLDLKYMKVYILMIKVPHNIMKLPNDKMFFYF